jgi:hypothetical protein
MRGVPPRRCDAFSALGAPGATLTQLGSISAHRDRGRCGRGLGGARQEGGRRLRTVDVGQIPDQRQPGPPNSLGQ